jgi:CxxC motif-containing protein (DUF1111 family)
MNHGYRIWYLVVLLVALAPAAARLALWQRVRSTPVDPDMAVAGKVLFLHDWTEKDPLCPEGDGRGPFFNATSCVACHQQGGPGGGGGLEHNVTTFTVRRPGEPVREGVVHAFSNAGVRPETLRDVDKSFPEISRPTLQQLVVLVGQGSNHCLTMPSGVHVSQRNTPALFGSKLIDDIPERVILAGAKAQRMKWGMAPADEEMHPVGRAVRLADGRIGRFGWKGQIASLSDFVQAACANELGLGNPGQAQPSPIYLTSAATKATAIDLTLRQCDELTAFCASLPRPTERLPEGITSEDAAAGKVVFSKIGCADCHTPKLGSVDGIYSDLLLHRMGQDLVGGGSYGEPRLPPKEGKGDEGPSPSEWRTPPLWGVADSAPYMHDGRAATLQQAIEMHGGQAARSAADFRNLSPADKERLIGFLKTLRAPELPSS